MKSVDCEFVKQALKRFLTEYYEQKLLQGEVSNSFFKVIVIKYIDTLSQVDEECGWCILGKMERFGCRWTD